MNISDIYPAFASIIVSVTGIVVFGDYARTGTDRIRRCAAGVWVLCMIYVAINRTSFVLGYAPSEIVADIGRVLTPAGWAALAIMETRRHH